MTQNYLINEIDKATTSPSTDIDKLTAAHDAHRSNFSGTSDPVTAVPYQVYANTTSGVYKQRNSGDTAWNIISSATDTPVIAKTGNYTAVLSDYAGLILVDASSGPVTITLPSSASTGNGWYVVVKRIDPGINIVNIASADTIDGVTSISIKNENVAIGVRTNGTRYSIYNSTTTTSVGNLVLLDRYTSLLASEVLINNHITSLYDSYVLRYNLTFSTAGDGLQIVVSDTNGSSYITTSDYSYALRLVSSADTESRSVGSNVTQWNILTNVSGSLNDVSAGEARFYHMLQTDYTLIKSETNHTDNTGAFVNEMGGGRLEHLDLINALKLEIATTTSGTFSGDVEFFGVVK